MNKLKQIEKKVREKFILDRYEATCEMIMQAELGIKFFESKEGIELQGSEIAKQEVLKFQEILRIKRSEKQFMKSLLK